MRGKTYEETYGIHHCLGGRVFCRAERRELENLGLIDEYQLMVVPVILGAGKYLFKDVSRLNLGLVGTKIFRNGRVLLRYQPEA